MERPGLAETCINQALIPHSDNGLPMKGPTLAPRMEAKFWIWR